MPRPGPNRGPVARPGGRAADPVGGEALARPQPPRARAPRRRRAPREARCRRRASRGKTAYLAMLLKEAGAEVVASGSNPGSTQDPICAALVARGIEVHARHGASREQFDADLLTVADARPEIVVDDGAELTARIVEHRPEVAAGLRGVTEETTTGVARLRAMAKAGKLTFPAIAANDALCKHLFDNRYGTGQSTLAAIDRLTNLTFQDGSSASSATAGSGRDSPGRHEGGRTGHRRRDRPVARSRRTWTAIASRGRGRPPRRGRRDRCDRRRRLRARARLSAHLKDGVLIANGGHHEREVAIDGLAPGRGGAARRDRARPRWRSPRLRARGGPHRRTSPAATATRSRSWTSPSPSRRCPRTCWRPVASNRVSLLPGRARPRDRPDKARDARDRARSADRQAARVRSALVRLEAPGAGSIRV